MSERNFTPEDAAQFHVTRPDTIPTGRLPLITDDFRSHEELLEGIRRSKREKIARGEIVLDRGQHNYSTDNTLGVDEK